MTAIITADIHETDNPKDEYRWGLFPWLEKQVTKTGAKHAIFLGDLTVQKDRHPAKLVNRFVNNVNGLAQHTQVIILRANHDCIDENSPFFGFLQHLHHRVIFINEPTELFIDDGIHESRKNKPCLFLPSTRHWETDWAKFDFKSYAYIFTHQTYNGAIAENGMGMRGISPTIFDHIKGLVISGDVHVPQQLGNVVYVGAPYHIHFGDQYKPRLLLLRKGELSDLHFPCLTREVVVARRLEDVEALEFKKDTQIKIRMKLKRSEFPDWPAMKHDIKFLADKRGWDLCGLNAEMLKTKDRKVEDEPVEITPEDILLSYAKRKKLDNPMTEAGLEFLREATT